MALSPTSTKRSETDVATGVTAYGQTFVALLFVICLLSPLGASAEEGIEHPFIEPKEIKPETCLTCHPEKKEGRFVHTAMGMGCESCHRIISEKNRTTITLLAAGGQLCARCHEARKDPVLHGPYQAGQCLTCHEPHSSPFKAQTRSAGNSLCLECHAPKLAKADTVTLFSFQKVSKADFEAIPKITLDPTLDFGHPCATHPVARVPDPLHEGQKMSCLSCHTPHAAGMANLLVSGKGARGLCDSCHGAVREPKQAKLESQLQSQLAHDLSTQFSSKPCGNCRNSAGGDPCAE